MEQLITSLSDFFGRLFSPLTDLLGRGLEYFHTLGMPWWLSIVVLTVIVRSLLVPLTIKQVKNMRAMQELRPEMDKIRKKYKDDRQKQQEELMKLYRERQFNPLGGCFPLLLQMPIFLGMFYVIRSFGDEHPDFSSGGLLWFQDLSVQDPYFVLPVLSAVTMLAASEITARNMDPQQRWLMRILPVGIIVFLLYFPAGLFMYWITSNLVTLVQNYVIYNGFGGGGGGTSAAATPGGGGGGASATAAPGGGARFDSSGATVPGSPASDGTATAQRGGSSGSGRKRKRKKKR